MLFVTRGHAPCDRFHLISVSPGVTSISMSTEQHPLIAHLQAEKETLTAFAERIEMSRMQLYRIMNGESTTLSTLRKISAATGGAVPVSAFLGSEESAA